MSYDGPSHYRLTRKLKKIAKAYGMGLRFKPSVGFEAEYWVNEQIAVLQLDVSATELISNFFHELGHHVDYNTGRFRTFYANRTPLYIQRRVSLKAERHADKVGEELCSLFFPKVKFRRSYRSKEDVQFNREFYADGRRTNPLTRTLMQGTV